MVIIITVILGAIGIASDLFGIYEGSKGLIPKKNKVLLKTILAIGTKKKSPNVLLKYYDFIYSQGVEIKGVDELIFRESKTKRWALICFLIILLILYLMIFYLSITSIDINKNSLPFVLILFFLMIMTVTIYSIFEITSIEALSIERKTLQESSRFHSCEIEDISKYQFLEVRTNGDIVFQAKEFDWKCFRINKKLTQDEIQVWETIITELIKSHSSKQSAKRK